ncbi:MAG TPA: hypothetical protein VJU59_07995 [Paraburkholderia sp.]|uniref:hypothetical protein n=1 Tax=Paraburkholderia sp. TaxID=1926495 RepID=UPI002B473287|nr:hypothetical protein [Paraburkholderia sp.]HKR39607.1 hypothetical protein [Paraburkholderia sp.]
MRGTPAREQKIIPVFAQFIGARCIEEVITGVGNCPGAANRLVPSRLNRRRVQRSVQILADPYRDL